MVTVNDIDKRLTQEAPLLHGGDERQRRLARWRIDFLLDERNRIIREDQPA